MHEMAYVHNVLNIVNEHAEQVGAKKVQTVYLTIGMGRDIIEKYFQGLFNHLARGTAAQDAEIVIRSIPLTVKCNRCGCVFHLDVRDESTWRCPECKTPRDYTLNSGMEFRVESMTYE